MLGHTQNKTITLGRYEIVKHLARGGMAEVFLARATGIEGFERHVVIKRIRAEQAHDKSHVQMFLEEARLAATLHHHNIVQVHDIGEQEGEYFFVMEYVHGEDACKLLAAVSSRGERPPLEHVLTIITAAAAGLHHAHEQRGPNLVPLGIVHRDVSPENILVGYDGSVKVADFGIAKAARRTRTTDSGVLKGKVSYMSPEQCVGRPVDRRSDIFSLGIVLYESLTMRPLFKNDNDFLSMAAIVAGQVPPPSAVWPEIPPELEEIVMKALAPSPDDRYATADDMRLALEAFAAKIGLQTSTTTLADYMKAQFGRRLEPWLAEDDEPEIELSIDVDGSGSGIVPMSRDAIRTLHEPTPAAPARVVLPRRKGRLRWFAAGVGAAAMIVTAAVLVLVRSSSSAASPAAIEVTWPSAPGRPHLADLQPALPSGPSGPPRDEAPPPPVVAPTPPSEAPGNGADPSKLPAHAPSPAVKRHYRTPGPATPKKHWDPHTLFPR